MKNNVIFFPYKETLLAGQIMAVAATFVYCPRREANVHALGILPYGKMERPVIINTVG